MSQLARSIDVSGIQQAAAQTIDTSALRQVAAQAVDTAQIAAQARQALQPMITQWFRSLAQSPIQRIIEQFQSDVRRAISDGISNFSPPSEYDPESVEVHPFVERVAYSRLESFLDDVSESEELLPYENRLRTALEFHDEGQYHAPIFICISVQDGLMHTLCQLRGVSPSDTSRFGDPIYKWGEKKEHASGGL